MTDKESKQPQSARAKLEELGGAAWAEFVEHYREKRRKTGSAIPEAAPHCVTIFGAGVAGLTAAHELVERGFRVQVWEPVSDERDPSRGCDVGGMARSQWSRVDWPENVDVGCRTELNGNEWKSRQTARIRHLPWVFYMRPSREPRVIGAIGERHAYFSTGNDAVDQPQFERILREMIQSVFSGDSDEPRSFYCEVQRLVPSKEIGYDRAKAAIDSIQGFVKGLVTLKLLGPPQLYAENLIAQAALNDKPDRKVDFHITLLDDFPDGLPADVEERISFRVRERWIPGEHGFRFFPAFYRHLFDTMKRTPILEPAEKSVTGSAQERAVTVDANPDKYVETGRSVFDNLQATKKQVISLPNSIGPTVLSRSLPKSFEELREWLRLALEPPPSAGTTTKGGFGFTVRDVAQFQLKFLQYLTSCEKRRGDYGHITWLEFLGGEDAYSEQFVSILNNIPEALVAMDARVSDARTQGSVFAQLMLDNVKPDGYRDGTLVGPTSVAWLTPWRRYLEAQGVEFIHGKIVGFKPATGPTGEPVVWPDVECYEPRYLGALKLNPALMPGYFVLALPAVQLQRVARSFCDVAGTSLSDDSDIRRAAEFLSEADREGIEGPLPTGALRHMVGIQFYFDEDIYWRDGHFYLPMSKWGISAISQVRFWQDKHDWEHGYRGVLSVVFTVLERDGATLWQLSPEAIAEEIWERIRESLGDGDLPHPRYWHMDFGFRPKDATNAQAGYDNQTPMLINIPGQWDKRPGDLIPITDEDIKPKDKYSGYKVEEGVVLAGTMMKTYTRLTTMEAANESGRHAVNAILQHAQSSSPNHYTPCDIWPVELHEIDDLAFLKEVDAELYARRLDHFIEILDLDKLIRNALRGDRKRVNDPLDPLAILSQLDRILKSLKSEVISVIRNHKVVP